MDTLDIFKRIDIFSNLKKSQTYEYLVQMIHRTFNFLTLAGGLSIFLAICLHLRKPIVQHKLQNSILSKQN